MGDDPGKAPNRDVLVSVGRLLRALIGPLLSLTPRAIILPRRLRARRSFAARRLMAEPVLMLFAARQPSGGTSCGGSRPTR